MGKYLSGSPDDAESGGGLFTGRGKVVRSYTQIFAFTSREAPVLTLEIEDQQGETHEEHLSAGSADRIRPSKDGKGFISVGDAKGLRFDCNAMLFVTSAVQAGFPKRKLADGDYSVFEGMEAEFIRVPQPQRNFTRDEEDTPKRKYPPTVLNVAEIYSSAETKPSAAKGKAAAPANGEGAEEEAQTAINDLLSDPKYRKGISVAQLYPAVFQRVKASANKKEVLALTQNEDWLGSNFSVDDGVVTRAS